MAAGVTDRAPIGDGAPAPVNAEGLSYPFGGRGPAPGELMTIVPGLRWWRAPMRGPLRHVNGYVLGDTGAEGLTVVDTGVNDDEGLAAWEALLAGPLAADRIAAVLVTHMHPDHVGLAGWLCRRHAAPLMMSRAEWLYVRMLIADRRDETPPEMIAFWQAAGWNDAQVEAARAHGWGNFARLVAKLPLGFVRLVDGETRRLGGADWQVVVGSGHSPEHACLFDATRGVLIAGDQVLPRISSNVSLTVSEPDGDPLGDWLASIERFRRLPDDLLILPGHGDPFHGLHARLDALAGEHRQRLDMLAEHLATPARATDCFSVLFRRPIDDPMMLGMATGEALAHLRRLEIEGRAVREVRGGVWWFHRA